MRRRPSPPDVHSADAVVIGGGHNGLTLAAYLQRAGLRTVLVEARESVGGMTRTEEPLLAGFRHNPHANYLAYLDLMPAARDFGLADAGLSTAWPEAQHGICFSDGRPPIVLHRTDQLDRSCASIGRYSRHDADVFRALKHGVDRLDGLLAAGMYQPPRRDWFAAQRLAVGELAKGVGVDDLGASTSRRLIERLFETPELRALLFQLATEFGARLDDPGSDLSFLGLILWLAGHWRVPIGGMQSVAEALRAVAERQGARILTGSRALKIEVVAGRVRGVHVSGLGRIRTRIVASSAGLIATHFGLLDASALSAREAKALRAYERAETPTLASLMFCLQSPPRYKSAKWDPAIDRCFHTVVGFDTPEEFSAHVRDVERGYLPSPGGALRVNTLWDPSQAPPGGHVAGCDAFMPSARSQSPDDWAIVEQTYNEAFLARWRMFAPNVSGDMVLAHRCELPGDYERKLRFAWGSDQYRTQIEGLYICGASTYPGGGVHGACGYNAFQAIQEDGGLETGSRGRLAPRA